MSVELISELHTPTAGMVPTIGPASDPDTTLVAAASRGDLAAFGTLVSRHERRVFRLAQNITHNYEDAEEVTQDAFVQAFKHLAGFHGESRFSTWLTRIAINQALMKLRKRRTNLESRDLAIGTEDDSIPHEIADWGPTPEQRYSQLELQEILAEAVGQLSSAYRIVFQLRDMEELSTEETAEMLGLSVPAVKTRLLRARLELRENLNRYFRPAGSNRVKNERAQGQAVYRVSVSPDMNLMDSTQRVQTKGIEIDWSDHNTRGAMNVKRLGSKAAISPIANSAYAGKEAERPLKGRVASSRLSLFLFSVLVLLISSGCGDTKASSPTFERPPAPVSVAAAVTQDVPIYLDGVGKCVAREVVSVQPQVSGRITGIHFTDGAELKKGDPLFTIDPRPYQAELHAAEANLVRAKADLDLARTQFARIADLVDTRAIAKQDYDTRKNAVAVAEAQAKQNEAAVETARLNLEYTSIRSPIDGRAGHRLVDIGNVVTANTGSLLSIQRLNPIYADFTVTENDLSEVQRHMKQGSLKVEVRLPDETDRPIIGQLTFLDNAVQDTTGTVTLRATVPNNDHLLWPGRFVKVRLILTTLQGAVLVPAAAPQMSARGPFVYVVKEDSTAELRPVRLGQRQGELIVINQGVKAAERVVINGQLGVTPGGKVRIDPSSAKQDVPTAGAGSKL